MEALCKRFMEDCSRKRNKPTTQRGYQAVIDRCIVPLGRRKVQDVKRPDIAGLQAVGEYAPEQVSRLAKLKKAGIASEAERLADGTGWVPVIFKTEGSQEEGLEQTPRRMPGPWRMNPPRRWPFDPRRRQAPRFIYLAGAFCCPFSTGPRPFRPGAGGQTSGHGSRRTRFNGQSGGVAGQRPAKVSSTKSARCATPTLGNSDTA